MRSEAREGVYGFEDALCCGTPSQVARVFAVAAAKPARVRVAGAKNLFLFRVPSFLSTIHIYLLALSQVTHSF